MLHENQRLSDIISSWTKSSASLQKLQGATKHSGDKTGLGYYSSEGSTAETRSNPGLGGTKFKTNNFVKTSWEQFAKTKSGDAMMTSKPLIRQGRFCGLGYTAPEKPRKSWLNKIAELIRGKPKFNNKTNQFFQYSMKDGQYKPQYRKPRSNWSYVACHDRHRTKNTHVPHKCFDAHTVKWIKSIQVWIQKGLIKPGLN
ncbi:beta-glucosidase 32-like [Dorcoceras hygrometricum]|uniref:Beta-glucosidase 32-like n=1 Tax=Dorcoceras hygrometricum TaxID=472368 RepID=A0A2Z7D5V1_9LAMI|nr:beta-glucosidase 32-like [Dorcoceras hygrometricum]